MKKIIALLLVVLTVFTLSGCNGYYTGHFYEAHCNSEELNVTRITVRLHNKEDVCSISSIYYELEYFDGDEVNVYIPQEVIVTGLDENGKKTRIKGTGLLAQALSHEIDHLNGYVFIDKIIPGTLEVVTSEE